MSDDEENFEERGTRERGKSKRSGRPLVRALVASLNWTEYAILYWTGEPAEAGRGTATAAVLGRLKGQPAGAYALRMEKGGPADQVRSWESFLAAVEPRVAELLPLRAPLIASALRRLLELRRFPRLLPELVGDAGAFVARCQAALARVRAVLDAGDDIGQLQHHCLLVGQAMRQRKSRREESELAGLCRGLNEWPADVVCEAVRRAEGGQVRALLRACPLVNRADAAEAVRDRLLMAPATLPQFLRELPGLLEADDRMAQEHERRLGLLVSMQRQCVETAVRGAGAAGEIWRCMAPENRNILLDAARRYLSAAHGAAQRYLRRAMGQAMALARPKERRANDPAAALYEIVTAQHLCDVVLSHPAGIDGKPALRWVYFDGMKQPVIGESRRTMRFENLAEESAHQLWMAGQQEASPARGILLRLAASRAIGWSERPPRWIEQWREALPLGNSTADPVRGVAVMLHALDAAIAPEHAEEAMRCMRHAARATFAAMLSQWRREMPYAQLADLPAVWSAMRAEAQVIGLSLEQKLDAAELAAWYREGRAPALHELIETTPAADLRAFTQFLSAWVERLQANLPPGSGAAELKRWRMRGAASQYWGEAYGKLGPELLGQMLGVLHSLGSQGADHVGLVRQMWELLEDLQFARGGPTADPKEMRRVVGEAMRFVTRHLRGSADAARNAALLDLVQRCLPACLAASADGPGPERPDAAAMLEQTVRALLGRVDDEAARREMLLGAYESHFSMNPAMRVAGAFSLGRADRLVTLLTHALNIDELDITLFRDAWRFLHELSGLPEALSGAACRGRAARAARVVARIGLCLRLRLKDELHAALRSPAPPAATPSHPLLTVEQSAAITELAALRPAFPERLRDALNRPADLAEELRRLEALPVLSASARKRAEHLRKLLDDPQRLAQWVRRDIDKVLPGALDEARLKWLEGIARSLLGSHFARAIGQPMPAPRDPQEERNWDNAVRLFFSVEFNRQLLRKLLRGECRGDRAWIIEQGENARFLRDVARLGIETAAWLAPMSRVVESPLGPCRIELETDPLHVLQMGNYFGTCLSEGDCNSFSTVANAVEINKRIIFLYDARGMVLGRKLIVLDRQGRIIGFRTYFSGPEKHWPWAKQALDQFCRELAGRCGGKLHRFPADHDHSKPMKLELFAKWYNDGPEEFGADVLKEPPARSRSSRRG